MDVIYESIHRHIRNAPPKTARLNVYSPLWATYLWQNADRTIVKSDRACNKCDGIPGASVMSEYCGRAICIPCEVDLQQEIIKDVQKSQQRSGPTATAPDTEDLIPCQMQ